MSQRLRLTLLFVFITASAFARAQDLEGNSSPASSTEQEIESLYDREDARETKPAPSKAKGRSKEPKDVSSLSDLATLAPFDDVAVIQRRFLPKTGRFEISAIAFSNLNNPFFNAFGGGLRAAYYLREKYAVEGIATFQSNGSRQVTDDLEKKNGITTDNVVTSKGFLGASFKWNPIYGKITWLNRTIVPFDLNFNVGFGMTRTDYDDGAPTLHLGTSQVFALSKSMAFRWDLLWNMYQGTSPKDTGGEEKVNQNDLFLGFGMSFYFPEAGYR